MSKVNHHITAAQKKLRRVRAKVQGTTERPRLHVFRSNKHISLQIIDDQQGKTLTAASTKAVTGKMTKTERTRQAALELAKDLKKNNITKLVFDRGNKRYHGRVKAVAEVMREAGVSV